MYFIQTGLLGMKLIDKIYTFTVVLIVIWKTYIFIVSIKRGAVVAVIVW